MRTSTARSLAAVLAAASLAACGSDSSTTPTPTGNLNVSALVAATSTANLTSGSRSLVSLPADASIPTIDPSQCPFSTANQDFECASVSRNGLTFKTSYTLLDASGHSMTQAVAANVASIHTLIDVTGTTTFSTGTTSGGTTSGTVTLHSHHDHTLSGLLTNTRLLNGTSTEHDTATTAVGTATTRTAINATTTTASLQVPQTSGQWPATGTITSDIQTASALAGAALTTSAHLVTTFNGTSIVTTQLTLGGRTTTCRIDLSGNTGPSCS